jgi:hypothetical protein
LPFFSFAFSNHQAKKSGSAMSVSCAFPTHSRSLVCPPSPHFSFDTVLYVVPACMRPMQVWASRSRSPRAVAPAGSPASRTLAGPSRSRGLALGVPFPPSSRTRLAWRHRALPLWCAPRAAPLRPATWR